MSVGSRRTRLASESADYDVSDLLSVVAKDSIESCESDGDAKQNDVSQARGASSGNDGQAQISLRERRRNRVQGIPQNVNIRLSVNTTAANGNSALQTSSVGVPRKSALWKRAATKAIANGDPWSNEGFDALPTEVATRYRFDTRNRKWVVEEVHVKMQEKSFGRGAMRECFRLKKKANFVSRSNEFLNATNCVAKRYLDPAVTRQTYFDDVYLQMDAKHWAELFNLNDPDPPKKIDLIQVSILEFTNRPGSPLYHLEHYIEGEYVKYNSNSGFIDAHSRMTPQAFSHFTFDRSGHRLIVVDVQGVGDLYTDPQIHTAYTTDMYGADEAPPYGDGNLGVRGMALFCYTHRCNHICTLLGLTPFAHSPYELGGAAQRWRSLSVSAGSLASPTGAGGAESPIGSTVVRQRTRTRSTGSWSSDEAFCEGSPLSCSSIGGNLPPGAIFPIREDASELMAKRHASEPQPRDTGVCGRGSRKTSQMEGDSDEEREKAAEEPAPVRARRRIDSQMLPGDADVMLAGIVDPLEYDAERHPNRFSPQQILALVHLDFARCYDSSRFAAVDQLMLAAVGATPVDSVLLRTIDKPLDVALHEANNGKPSDSTPGEVRLSRDECVAALFHLNEAAKLGNREALKLLAHVYLNLERDLLNCISDAPFANELFNVQNGLTYMRKAADFEPHAALFLAELYETGKSTKSPLPTCVVKPDINAAITYYAKALEMLEDDDADQAQPPIYEVQAKLAALYASEEVRDYMQAYDFYSAAAESATSAMKGKLASRYYEFAEQVSGMIEE